MKRSKNFTWLILGVITIVLGLIIPFVVFNQSIYYEFEKDVNAGSTTFYVTITSNEELEKVHYAIINLEYTQGEDREYEVYYVKSEKSDKNFIYEFKLVETDNWAYVDEIESIKLRTAKGEVEIDEKVGLGAKIPIAVFACVIGGFMIFVNFFNNNSKNRTIELKEIIASSAYGNNPEEIQEEIEHIEQTENEEKSEISSQNQTKECEYCGTLADVNEKVCSSCGAKFKKN